MCKSIQHCPNCVSEMGKDTRKLGKVSKWLKCPSCGLREEVDPTLLMPTRKRHQNIEEQDEFNNEEDFRDY
tara:strand:+ start:847 stop:1059 length:213 start_codon:yes stop_codon:yes gene_type:complete